MGAVVHVIQRSRCYVVWYNDFFFRFTWSEDPRVTFGDKETVWCQFGMSDQEPYFIIDVSSFGSWCLS